MGPRGNASIGNTNNEASWMSSGREPEPKTWQGPKECEPREMICKRVGKGRPSTAVTQEKLSWSRNWDLKFQSRNKTAIYSLVPFKITSSLECSQRSKSWKTNGSLFFFNKKGVPLIL
ncbi:hypothetical protein LAZ67_22000324 [Cordylochernes scorpioides]|uniref:Uncharacterized protein n=1 Tax=Cordylochernes scorpioides TaxID=51811 RepID=A0ABY6LP66_9ARAC|nr:hypothetical protein LAZ67_22000324 [Cordylochernes scorpioides]